MEKYSLLVFILNSPYASSVDVDEQELEDGHRDVLDLHTAALSLSHLVFEHCSEHMIK
jgi:hypothetical protein